MGRTPARFGLRENDLCGLLPVAVSDIADGLDAVLVFVEIELELGTFGLCRYRDTFLFLSDEGFDLCIGTEDCKTVSPRGKPGVGDNLNLEPAGRDDVRNAGGKTVKTYARLQAKIEGILRGRHDYEGIGVLVHGLCLVIDEPDDRGYALKHCLYRFLTRRNSRGAVNFTGKSGDIDADLVTLRTAGTLGVVGIEEILSVIAFRRRAIENEGGTSGRPSGRLLVLPVPRFSP